MKALHFYACANSTSVHWNLKVPCIIDLYISNQDAAANGQELQQLAVAEGNNTDNAVENAELSEEGLWGEITATLPSHWDKRGKITLPLPSVLSPSSIGLGEQVGFQTIWLLFKLPGPN